MKTFKVVLAAGMLPFPFPLILTSFVFFRPTATGKIMTSKEKLRMQIRLLRLRTWDRIIDLWNITLPIFITTGLLTACVRFWMWVFWR